MKNIKISFKISSKVKESFDLLTYELIKANINKEK